MKFIASRRPRRAASIINPPALGDPSGYSNGILCPPGCRMLFIAGQIAWDANHRIVGGRNLAAQFEQALRNAVEVVRCAGGVVTDIVEMTIFVTDARPYLKSLKAIGARYREAMGRHFPAMSLVVVKALLEQDALVEVRAVAAIPNQRRKLASARLVGRER